MWNQTADAKATSDNKQEEAAAAATDCSCAAAASVDQYSTVIHNSKTPNLTPFGGNDGDAISKQQKESLAQSETSDSGFISGPQSSQIFSEEIIIEQDIKTSSRNEAEEKSTNKQQQQHKEICSIALDSGLIEEEVDNSSPTEEAPKQEPGSTSSEQMRLKHNVDFGIPQWTVQSNLASSGDVLNNLSRKQTPAAAAATGNGNATNSNSINIMNAWEQFYQQNDDGDTPLHLACISGYVDVVAALIRMAPHPCLLNIQNDVAQTPLHLAALTAQPNILRMLLLAGAEPTVRDRHGNTALHLSCIAGEKQCVRALTEKFGATEIHEAHRQYGHRSNDKAVSSLSYARLPADLEIRNYDGERCVHLAAEGGHIDILRILVSHGADINAREGKSGRTPLHIAIECCNEDLANFLLDECEKLNLETATYAGLTAYQVACILNKSRMQNILEKRGAETLTPPDSDYDSSDIEDLDDTKMYDRFGDPRYFVSYGNGNPMTVA
ncbi:NF-kappa-B inhibitor cactus [Drosophila tropicalis]|uniref:NF-kappa-B inhibitor cactus n=1 Tax=Drosophila tropicalis TaxID=46794 RepID=UPI0035AB85D7